MLHRLFPSKRDLTPAELRLLRMAKREADSEETPPSPCISVCRMSKKNDFCEGCFRTLDEIAGWGHHAPEAKREVWRLISQRLCEQV